ncbi:PP1c_bdg domain-containing protein [Trichonephila clavata]|uniref:PP1c_bdg domain-containing protein n=1 Tax=Trichonephila clavata TaxID=2740835 RepID=A0A8X6L9Q5_TRICU|nr:PP1c_bdg domain-containing protein [Trichonephila clavata]
MLLMESEKANCDSLYEAIDITDSAENVQILPNTSSFFFSVDSSEDSDWDEISDSELLNDLADFQLTGLYVKNLTSQNKSQFITPSCHNEKLQIFHLNKFLSTVNDEWNQATKELDEKFKSPTKVNLYFMINYFTCIYTTTNKANLATFIAKR